ncbi:hypothetical protein Tco_0264694 [Tanacetum coccineum]
MENDMLKAQIKVVVILCELELIYPPALFDIMVHLVIHLPIEALEGGPINPRWMYPFERYMKKLKDYVQNKAKMEGLIAKGYVAEEALPFSSYYFWDVTTKFNYPSRNVDPPPPTFSRVPRSHGGEVAVMIVPHHTLYPPVCGGCFANKGKGKRKPNLGGKGAGRLNTRDKTWNLSLKEIAVAKGPVLINFEQGRRSRRGANGGDHFRDWGPVILLDSVLTSTAHGFPRWTRDQRRHQHAHMQKATKPTRPSFKAQVLEGRHPPPGVTIIDAIRRARPKEITAMRPTSSLGIMAGERIPHEASPASIPQRHVAGETYPQRHVAGESPDMSPGKQAIVVVL